MLYVSALLHSIVISVACATLSLGTIYEKDGEVSRVFTLYNTGNDAVSLIQTYPSCKCTSIYPEQKNDSIFPGDSIAVEVRFNPKNKGGEFYETATLVFSNGVTKKPIVLALQGNCITSEETLLMQYPIEKEQVRISRDSIDLGELHIGETKTSYIGVLHRQDSVWTETIPVDITANHDMGWGVQSVKRCVTTVGDDGRQCDLNIEFRIVVLPELKENEITKPSLYAKRFVTPEDKGICVENKGDAVLTVYRAYTSFGKDLLDGTLSLNPGESSEIVFPDDWESDLRTETKPRITLITNDSQHARFSIRVRKE